MNMNRRSFLKGMFALSAIPFVAQLPAWDESPITKDNPLAWLYLDEHKFALEEWVVVQYGLSDNLRWSAECTMAGDQIDNLRAIMNAGEPVSMRIVPPSYPYAFLGSVRANGMALTLRDRKASSAVLLFGSGVLVAEDRLLFG